MDENSADFVFERVLTNVSDISTPGHIISNFPSLRDHMVYERIIFLPEDFFVNLENNIIKQDPNRGKERLYAVGKKFGYRFASLFDLSREDVKKSIYAVFRYLETLYAERVEIREIDIERKTMRVYAKNLVVTDRNDRGYVLPIGGCGGIWSYLFDDYTLECSHRKISDTEVEVVMAPADVLRGMGLELITCGELPAEIDWDTYKIRNTPKRMESYDYFSMEKFMKSGVILYNRGEMDISKVRLVSIELSLLFSIEQSFSAEDVFTASYETFSRLSASVGEKADPYGFVGKFFTALGFGRVKIIGTEDRVIFNFSGYPWLSESFENSSFGFVKGAVIGFLDRNTDRKNKIGDVSHTVLDNSFILTLEVSRG